MYQLADLTVTYTAKLREQLVRTIGNLKSAIDAASAVETPQATRLPRRAWRVWYLKSPFRDSIRKKHYIFQDWRYQFRFSRVADVRPVISSVLGAATRDTSSTVDFAWHFPGTKEFPATLPDTASLISQGRANYLRKNALWLQETQGGWRQQYAHWNYKQYVPREQR